MKKGFTLAEVLITLGIIGVVAALTMPALIGNYKKTEYSARLKKFYSTMQQAIIMYNNDSGEIPGEWESSENSSEALEQYWNQHFASYFQNVIRQEKAVSEGRNAFIVYFGDGTKLFISKGGTIDLRYDVNGDKLPNSNGRDQYVFLLKNGNFNAYNWIGDIDGMESPEGEDKYTKDMNDRNNILRLCKRSTAFCSQLLLLDGWEYKPDYPHRL